MLSGLDIVVVGIVCVFYDLIKWIINTTARKNSRYNRMQNQMKQLNLIIEAIGRMQDVEKSLNRMSKKKTKKVK